VKVGGHRIAVGDRVRFRSRPTEPWVYGRVTRIEGGLLYVVMQDPRFGTRRGEWPMSELAWHAERGCLEFKPPL
jgi:hypothetical protein